jgi:hypothetical protein
VLQIMAFRGRYKNVEPDITSEIIGQSETGVWSVYHVLMLMFRKCCYLPR